MKETRKRNKGITLIALVITIIVLLILAGVSIASLTGENGILSKAQRAKELTNKESLQEQIQRDILAKQVGDGGRITKENFKEVLDKYFDGIPDNAEDLPDDLTDWDTSGDIVLKEEYGGKDVQIQISDLYKGQFKQEVIIEAEETTSYVGYYADLNGDKTPDGIIYADLAIGQESKKWNNHDWSVFQYDKVESGLKKYAVGREVTDTRFGLYTAPLIIEIKGSGLEDRFYVMALEDMDGTRHYWYKNAYGKLDNIVPESTNDFGKGKEYTETMINDAVVEKYGERDVNDMWKILKENGKLNQYGKTWFVPSKSEWSAFADMCWTKENIKMETRTYGNFGLSGYYWSSSKLSAVAVYNVGFYFGTIYNRSVSGDDLVRLSTTF